MKPDKKTPEELLLDLHLDRLSEEDRVRLEAELRKDPALRAKSGRLGAILRPLDHWTVPPAAPNLADKVLLYVRRAAGGGGHTPSPEAVRSGPPRSHHISLRDLVALAACLVLMMGILLPSMSGIRSRARRTQCAGNLGSIYRATRLYQNIFSGSLPFAGNVPGPSWLPERAEGIPFASNSRHMYLLVKSNLGLALGSFVCPACKLGEPIELDDPARYEDFAGAGHICYDSLNMGGRDPNLRPRSPIAYMSDSNPLFISGAFDESVDPDTANSPAHKGVGQNVMSLDGRVTWSTSPFHGPRRDNIWTAQGIRAYKGTEFQTREDDAFLIPGFPDANGPDHPGTGR